MKYSERAASEERLEWRPAIAGPKVLLHTGWAADGERLSVEESVLTGEAAPVLTIPSNAGVRAAATRRAQQTVFDPGAGDLEGMARGRWWRSSC